MPYVIVTYDKGGVNNRVKTVTIICALLIFGRSNFSPFAILAFLMFATWRDAGVWVKRARIEIVTHGGLLIEKNIGLLSLDQLSLFQKLLGNNHLFHAITADYVDCLCRSAAITAFRANVFAGTAGLFGSAPALGECAENIQQGNALDHL